MVRWHITTSEQKRKHTSTKAQRIIYKPESAGNGLRMMLVDEFVLGIMAFYAAVILVCAGTYLIEKEKDDDD
jgi:hypothetical protein|tara:strand:+ start:448 stop:663 length:216 start_codon:yes stop_codon:yes gene_type:complete